MKVWLDDVRQPWKHGHIDAYWAKTYEEAIKLLETGRVKFISLDHDLGYKSCELCQSIADSPEAYTAAINRGCKHTEKTRYDVLRWMEQNHVWPETILIHSMNPAGRQAMQMILDKYGK